ncbi:MAG: hypothetical protein JJ975_07525 [Bacteroidia bacterium]|nr:hypothetical protein [Bacteroidia bacterium]
MKRSIKIILILFMPMAVCAQDSIRIDSKTSLEMKGQHNIAVLTKNNDCFNCLRGQIQDNPFHHFAIYSGIKNKLVLNQKYSIETGLYLEERSHSGGNNTLANIVVFPKILIEVNDTLRLGSTKVLTQIKGGDYWDEDVDDILRLYNIDYHGLSGQLRLKKLSFGFMTIGDLSQNVGLDLHQLYRFSLGYHTKKIRSLLHLDINDVVAAPIGTQPAPRDANISNYSHVRFSESLSLKTQASVRINDVLPTSLGAVAKLEYNKPFFKFSTAARYFQSNFNYGYNGNFPRYYWANGGYLGPQLYPLKNYYRNFSQWAVYTHFGNVDILAWEVTSEWQQKLYQKISAFYEIDFNLIYDLTNDQAQLYPFYNAGLQVNFLKGFSGRASVTNKHMELLHRYQTISASKRPFLSLGVNLNLDEFAKRTLFIKG